MSDSWGPPQLALAKRYPHLDISYENKDIQDLIIDDTEHLNSSNLNVVCVGDYSTEILINEFHRKNLISIPTMIVWVEPFIKAGQAVLLLPKKQGCFTCLFDTINKQTKFKYRISEPSENDIKREFGCQSSYIPYGAIDICNFTNFLTRIIDKIHRQEFNENMLFQFIKDDNNLNYSINIKSFNELDKFNYCCIGKD